MTATDDANRLCLALQADTASRPNTWRMVHTIAVRARIKDPKAIDAAVKIAVENEWLLVEQGHSIALTEAGRRL